MELIQSFIIFSIFIFPRNQKIGTVSCSSQYINTFIRVILKSFMTLLSWKSQSLFSFWNILLRLWKGLPSLRLVWLCIQIIYFNLKFRVLCAPPSTSCGGLEAIKPLQSRIPSLPFFPSLLPFSPVTPV